MSNRWIREEALSIVLPPTLRSRKPGFSWRSEFSAVSGVYFDALSWTGEMGNRIIPALILTALLVPLPKAMSAPFRAASGPFADVPADGTVQVVAAARRMVFFGGLEALVTTQGSAAAAPTRTAAASAEAIAFTTQPASRGADEALTTRHTYTATSTPPGTPPVRVTVVQGDTLFDLARRYNTSIEAIATANNLPSAHVLRIGQELTLPVGAAPAARSPTRPAAQPVPRPARASRRAAASTTYEVQNGDTLFAIALRYRTTVDTIVAANGLSSAHRLRVGQRLVVPGSGVRTPARAEVVPRGVSRPVPSVRATLSWPSRGAITSRYGWRYRRHHDGIDIASSRGTPIYAARAGRVVFAGWYYGYGRAVIIDHGDGVRTLYGHASALLVLTGATVEQGELIARVGCTGRCTGSHLHFEVRINGRAVNPLPYLR